MSRLALLHSYPQWEPPEDDLSAPVDEWRQVWTGKMRIVRNYKRARLLRRRGVPMWDLHERGKRLWLWFVEPILIREFSPENPRMQIVNEALKELGE